MNSSRLRRWPTTAAAIGVALGFPVEATDGEVQWQNLLAKVGTLLIGLQPVLPSARQRRDAGRIAGPLETASQAAELCGRLDKVGIPVRAGAVQGRTAAAAQLAACPRRDAPPNCG
jgi:hypothetical protein